MKLPAPPAPPRGAAPPSRATGLCSAVGIMIFREATRLSTALQDVTYRTQSGPRLVAQREAFGFGCSGAASAGGREIGDDTLKFHKQIFPASAGHVMNLWSAAYDQGKGAKPSHRDAAICIRACYSSRGASGYGTWEAASCGRRCSSRTARW